MSLQPEDIRALPHVAEGLLGHQLPLQRPVTLIRGGVDQDSSLILAAAVLLPGPGPGSQNHVVDPVLLPDLGIPHMLGDVLGIILHSQKLLLGGHLLAVLGLHQQLGGNPARVNIVIIPGKLHISRIKQVHAAILHQG